MKGFDVFPQGLNPFMRKAIHTTEQNGDSCLSDGRNSRRLGVCPSQKPRHEKNMIRSKRGASRSIIRPVLLTVLVVKTVKLFLVFVAHTSS